jgi:hypothetical protein
MSELRRVKWVDRKDGEDVAMEGWLHQFIAIHDRNQYLYPHAIVERDDGKVIAVDIGLVDFYFAESYKEEKDE